MWNRHRTMTQSLQREEGVRLFGFKHLLDCLHALHHVFRHQRKA